MDDLNEYDGVGLAQLVRDGELTASEVVEASISCIERLNPVLNAVVYSDFNEARKSASAPCEGSFAGVPMLIKDLGLTVAKWPLTSGSKFALTIPNERDCGLVSRYRGTGAVLLGRSATAEFGMIGTTETAAYGATRNPWNPAHIAGGSSGGAAAAVASGMVPIAHASDGLGSIRIPAACCGLVGLKPTRDRVCNLPDGVDYAIGFVCDHVLTRTVRDSATMLDETGKSWPGSPYAQPPKAGLFVTDVGRNPGRLRIHWSSMTRLGSPVSIEVETALQKTAQTLESLGHDVREQPLRIDEIEMLRARLPISAGNFAASMRNLITAIGREPADGEIETYTEFALSLARQVTAEQVFTGLQTLRVLCRDVVQQFDDFDVYLSPVMVTPAPEIGTINSLSRHPALTDAAQHTLYPYPMIFNFTGQPSISLPLQESSLGLPIGMMFSGRYGDESTLIALAGQLEKELPWHARKPVVR